MARGLRQWATVVALLWLGMALAMWAASTQAGTYDEVTFLGVGRYLWHTGNFDIQHARFHPPLMYYVNSVFLELTAGRWDAGLDATGHFTYFAGRGYLYDSGLSPDGVLLLARYPFILLFVLLASVLYRWGREVYGHAGAVLALALFTTSPTILAHASIAGNDFLLTATFTLTLFVLWRATRRGGAFRWLLVGGLWGATLLTKATGVILWGLVPALTLWAWWLSRRGAWPQRISLARAAAMLGLAAATAVVTLVAGYGFHALPAFTPATRPHRRVDLLVGWLSPAWHARLYTLIEQPIPGYRYITMLLRQFRHVSGGHDAYLLGRWSTRGWTYFFPLALTIKTPLSTLLLWAAGLTSALHQGWTGFRKRHWEHLAWLVWWGSPILGPALIGSANMGVRLILPVYPFLFLFAGAAVLSVQRRGKMLLAGLVLAGLLSVTIQAPRYLSYVNELWGGPAQGWRYVGDSNYDWGQSLKELKAYLQTQGIDEVYLAYFGGEDPARRGIRYRPAPCTPVRGVVVVSVTYLQGLYLDNRQCYAWLRAYRPTARVGHTLWVYDLR